jgi:hypothetical protein
LTFAASTMSLLFITNHAYTQISSFPIFGLFKFARSRQLIFLIVTRAKKC